MNSWIKQVSGWTFAVCLLLGLSVQAQELPDFTQLVKDNIPAVVNISTKTQKKTASDLLPEFPELPEDSPFREFFKFFERQGQDGEEEGDSPEFQRASLGSGFIIDAEGHVVTNHHVIDNAEEIIVRLSDRREFEAKLLGADERSDLALLKIDAPNLPFVKIGSSKSLQVGEWVLAIGSPFGFEHSVTAGIVSAKRRSLPGSDSNYVPFIQTDVAINPGNSGGPLFNLQGEVIGVNAQIYSQTGGFMGLSFTIPIDMAMEVIQQLQSKGKVSRGWLGVLIQEVDRGLAESFGMDKPQGALVAEVLSDTPASKADFQVGDVIIEFNGYPVERSSELPPLVGLTPIGETVIAKVIRAGELIEVPVLIGELPGKDELEMTRSNSGDGSGSIYTDKALALSVAELTDKDREKLNFQGDGLLVKQVKSGPAADAGLRKGDILTMLNQQPLSDVKVFKDLLASLEPGQVAAVLIQRGDSPLFIAIRIPKP